MSSADPTLFRPDESDGRRRSAVAPGVLAVPEDSIDLGRVLGIMARQWLLILLVTILFAGAGLAYSMVATKIYQATTRVLLDPRDKQILGTDVVRPNQGVDLGWVETQVDLVTSYATLKKVVEDEHLVDDPEFGGGDMDVVMASLASHIRAERPAETYVIDISVSSVSAQKAARLSGAVADAFIRSLTEAKQNAARQANELILRQIDDLKANSQDADQKVQAYRQQHNVVEVDGKPVDEQTLSQLNEASVAAGLKADQASQRADRIDAIIRSGVGDFGNALDTIDSPLIGRLKIEYALAVKQQAELGQTLGSRHPRMTALGADIARTKSLMVQELKSLADRARTESDLAKAQVASIAAALAAVTRQVTDTSEASVALRALEAEAAIRRDAYKAFVARAQETGLQENLQIADARVISPAQVPVVPTSPKKKIIVGLSLIGGFGLGLSLALYRGRRRMLASLAPAALPEATPRALPSDRTTDRSRFFEPLRLAPLVLADIPVPALLSDSGTGSPDAGEMIRARSAEADAALTRLSSTLTKPAETEGPAVHVIFGTAASGAVAAIAFQLARHFAEGGAETLLIDANVGPVTTGSALIGKDMIGIIDVELDGADPSRIGRRLDSSPIVLLPVASAGLRHLIGDHDAALLATIRDVAASFERIVIDLGPSCPPALFTALSDVADDVVMVVDAGEAHSPAIGTMIDDLGDLVPQFRGLATVRDAAVIARAPQPAPGD